MFENLGQLVADLGLVQALQMELKASGQHRGWKFLRIGRGKKKLEVLGGLFQGLEQSIEAVRRQHVHFVNQVHLETTLRRDIGGIRKQFTHFLHAGAGGGINLQEIREFPFVDAAAGFAHAAGFRADSLLAVQTLGDDARQGGLAHTPGSREQVRMMQPVVFERLCQDLKYMLLADHFGKRAGPPSAGQNFIRHGGRWGG